MPDLNGYSKEKINVILDSLGISAVFNGNGLAAEQSINPNVQVEKGTVITVDLEEIGD